MNKPISLFSRRWIIASLLSGAAGTALADAPLRSPVPLPRPTRGAGSVRQAASVESLIATANLDGKIGFVVADAVTGKILETHNPLLALPPASTAKAVTTAYALAHLGGAHRFHTSLVATGPAANGVLKGDLVLVGSGDPSLDTDALAELAKRLKKSGITQITGRFLTYAKALPHLKQIDPSQPDHVGYNPAIGGLNLNYNRVHFEWKRSQGGYAVTMDARSKKFRPDVDVARMQIADRSLPVYTYSEKGGVDYWSVARSALGKGGARWLPVRQPEAYCADVFRTFARANGIVLPEGRATGQAPQGRSVANWTSEPLATLSRDMMKYSTNLTAEVLGLSASAKRSGKANSLKGSARDMTLWLAERTGANKARFVDHSGLGESSQISAQEMVRMLVKLGPELGLEGLMKEIRPLDAKGRAIKDSALRIRAKTGTLNFVSALCGYIDAPDGRKLAFAVFCADTAQRAKIKKADREAPRGGKSWTRRARILHSQLIARWSTVYGA